MEPIIEKLNNGYSVNLCEVVDKIHYINSITFNGVSSPLHPVIQPIYCVAETPSDITLNLPRVNTISITEVLKDSVLAKGEVISEGASITTNRGFCWSTTSNPIIGNINTTINGKGIGEFTSPILGLASATTYYIKAYATNSYGTSYGDSITIITEAVAPILSTFKLNTIKMTSVKGEATIISTGGSPVIGSGLCWSTSTGPTIYNAKTTTGVNIGSFISEATNLLPNTTYYIRAYATNSVDTGYSQELSFTTLETEAIIANITSSLVGSTTTSYVVQWFISLSAPAEEDVIIPYVITNSTNTGDTLININFSQGQQYNGTTLSYTRPLDSNYIAYCNFSTMPTGYTAGTASNFTIQKQ